jgi:hypothetical protein
MANIADPGRRTILFGDALPRHRGAINGILLVLVGAWGALVPFFGPLIHIAYTPNTAWTYTDGRLWLNILPGAAAALAGLGVLGVTTRFSGVFWSWVAALAGTWFIIGPSISTLWTRGGGVDTGSPTASTVGGVALQQMLFYYGIGAAMVFLGGVALGRFTIGRAGFDEN